MPPLAEGSASGRSALVLVRTPLQAWVVERVLEAEGVSTYDVVYFTQQDSPEDRHYFGRLRARAARAQYCFAPVRRFDVLGHLDFRRQTHAWFRDQRRDLVMLASIDAPVPNAITARQRSSELVTFDDGLANIYRQGSYHVDRAGPRARLYRHLLGAEALAATRQKVARHYTLHPGFENIVDAARLRPLASWSGERRSPVGEGARTYFIGQPLEEVMGLEQVQALQAHVRTLGVDRYVKHPRERRLLDIGAPLLEKGGLIAEEAIVRDAGSDAIHLVGWFSSVLVNLGGLAERRTVLLPRAHAQTAHLAALAAQAGCEVVLL